MAELAARVVLTRDDFIVRNHRVHGVAVLPGVAFLDIVYRMLAAAGEDVARAVVRDVVFSEAVAAADGQDREIVCEIGPPQAGARPIRARSRWLRDGEPCSPWSENVAGRLVMGDDADDTEAADAAHPAPLDIAELRSQAVRVGDMSELYARARREEIEHGAPMRCRGPLYFGQSWLLARLELEEPGDGHEQRFHLHPAKLDASTLAGFALTEVSGQHPFIPMFVQEFRAPRSVAGPCYLYVPHPEVLAPSGDVITSDYALYDEQGRFLAGFKGLTCKRIRRPELITRLLPESEPETEPDTQPEQSEPKSELVPEPDAQPETSTEPETAEVAVGAADAAALAEHLRTMIAARLDRPAETVRTDVGFYDLGLDSLALLDLGRELEGMVGQALYPTLLFEHSDIDSLAAHLAATYQVTLPRSVTHDQVEAPVSAVTELRAPRWVAAPAPARRNAAAATVVITPGEVDGEIDADDIAVVLPADPDADVADGVRALWRLAVTAANRLPAGRVRLTAVCLAEDPDAAIPAALGALARTITAETPQVRCRVVTGPPALTVAELLELAGDDPDEVEVRIVSAGHDPSYDTFRDTPADRRAASVDSATREMTPRPRREIRRWAPVTDTVASPAAEQVLRPGGVYLISGGSGGIGRLLTEHLIDRYQAKVLLVGRGPEPPEVTVRLREWNRRGGEVRFVAADVSTAAGAHKAVAAAREAFGALDGVIHCAGTRRDRLYFRKDGEDFAAVLGPKAHGAQMLDAAVGDSDLDFFAVFSSLSACVANPGQADYAAANAFAEAVVQRRATRSDRHGRSVAIAWPYWLHGGMTVTKDVVRRAAEEKGTVPLPTSEALAVFEAALAAGEPRLAVLHGDPERVHALLPEPESAPEPQPEPEPEPGPEPEPDRMLEPEPVRDQASIPQPASVSEPAPIPEPRTEAHGIAIIGMAGRFPEAPDLEAFWRNLAAGRDSVTEVPADRWDHDAVYDPGKARGRTYGRWGGFLDGVDRFDAAFFGISRREAELMDPQERLFLTTGWHAVEDAGYAPEALRGRAVGVFAGVMWNHYQLLTDPGSGVAPTAMHSAIANRVSYALDLTGPSLAVDTACSSSLYAVHLAAQSMLLGECELALAGGVNVSVHPQKYLQLAQGRWLSEDGRCRSFGRDGSGYVPGEGVGCVLLKPLADALRDGDRVYGVIRASAVNHGGRTGGVTVPSPVAQAAVVAAAVQRAGWAPETIGYVEAHGTGTSLGDPIEVEGLRRALAGERGPDGAVDGLADGADGSAADASAHAPAADGPADGHRSGQPSGRRSRHRCALGSVKSNIGHLEGAAGIAGLIKVLLQMQHGAIAPSLHSAELNPRIDFADTPFVVPQQLTAWPRQDGLPRRAGVSAFGAGGANCHLLIEEAPTQAPARAPMDHEQGPWLFVLSARSDEALRDYAESLSARLTPEPDGGTLDRLAELLGVPPEAVDPGATLRDLALGPADLRLLVADGQVGLDDKVEDLLAGAEREHTDLGAVAATLQTGRTPMRRRLAVVADDASQLRSALQRYVGGAEPGGGGFWGPMEGSLSALSAEDCVAAFARGELAEVAAAWVAGAEVPWERCRQAAGLRTRRVSLPGYPFQEEPVWVGRWQSGTRLDGAATSTEPAPETEPEAASASKATTASEAVSAAEAATASHQVGTAEPAGAAEAITVLEPAAGDEVELRSVDDGLALITMRSPMFTPGLLAGLREAFAKVEADDGIRAVVLTGTGSVFSMGGTPEALASLAAGEGRFSDVPFLYEGLLRCTRPVVAAVQGHAAGGGLAFGLFADVAVLAEEADYRANFVAYGFTPGVGATFVLEHRLGAAVATELMLTGRALRGAELARRGAGVTIVPGSRVLATALDLARSMADKPPAAVRALKADLAARVLDALPAVVERELTMHERVLGPDAAQLVQERFARVGGAAPAATATATAQTEPQTEPRAEPQAEPQATAVDSVPDGGPADSPEQLPALDEILPVVEAILGSVLYLDPDELDHDLSFAELGLDSVGAVEVVGQVNQRFGTDLDSVAVYDHPTSPALAEAVRSALARSRSSVAAALRPAAPAREPAPSRETATEPEPAAEPDPAPPPEPGPPIRLAPLPEPPRTPEPAEPPPAQAAPARPTRPELVHLSPTTVAGSTPQPSQPAQLSDSAQPSQRTQSLQPAQSPQPTHHPTLTPEPVAVIGMSGRFPDAPDLDAFWANLAAGRSSIREVPAARWDVAAHYDPDRRVPDRTYSKWAAMLSDVAAFDAPFFQLSPLDAEAMDPQQRLFLQESWRALEDAGYAVDPGGARRPWGVFAGCGAGDYADLLERAGQGGTGQAFLGGTPSMLAARVAYLLNLSGPTIALDTACSSSLVAVDLACTALARGECEIALAGGVAVMATPKMHVWCSKTGMLSPTGRSAPFDAAADGIVLGEGVGVVVLKPLARALADGDHVHGVIRAGGVNGDGRTNGITAPSAAAQAELIARVHRRAGVGPEDIGYVEAHGTGTELGDPIEVKALTQVFRQGTGRTGYCGLGSVKGNIGHATLAAGIAGLLKVLLALRHRQLPPSVGYESPNPHLDLASGPFYVVREPTPWPPGAGGLRVGTVSSFGFSGTNAHLVVSEAPTRRDQKSELEREPEQEIESERDSEPQPERDGDRRRDEPVLVTLSARTDQALARQVADLAEHLDRLDPETPLADVAYTLAVGRRRLPRRAAFVAADHRELKALLSGFDPAGAPGETGPASGPDLVREAVRARDGGGAELRAALERLAAAYIGGLDLDLGEAVAGRGRRRVPLPTYPFDTKEYWPSDPRERVIAAADPVVADHRVGGVPVLPAADGIAMAVAAAADSGRRGVGNVRFLRPVRVSDRTRVRWDLRGQEFTASDADGVYLTAAIGDAAQEAPQALDLAAVSERCDQLEAAETRYEQFARAGIDYRGDFRILETLRHGPQEALATLRPVGSVRQPAVLDGAMQAAAPLAEADGALLPFAVERVTVFASEAIARYSHVRREAENRFTIAIADDQGRICARLDGVALRAARSDTPGAAVPVTSMIFVPEWIPAAAVPGPPAARVAIVADPGDPLAHALALRHGQASATIVAAANAATLWGEPGQPFDTVYLLAPPEPADPVAVTTDGLGVLRGMIDAGLGRTELTVTLVARGPGGAGLLGLGAAAGAELPRWRVRSIDADARSRPDDLAGAVLAADGGVTTFRNGRALRRRLVPVPAPQLSTSTSASASTSASPSVSASAVPSVTEPGRPAKPAEPAVFRANGVYVLVGGAGGLGRVLSRHLARTVGARIVWLGRRPEDVTIRAAMAETEALGGRIRYFQADVADAPALRAALAAAREAFGPFDGVVHTALELRDRTLAAMSEQDLAAVLAAKTAGVVALAEAVRDDPLDFLAFFSSALSFAQAPGQGNYAAASAFEDAYAARLRAEGLPAVVVNWGFWGSVGAVAAPGYRERFTALGIEPIEPNEGIAAFEHVLRARLPQALVVKGTPRGLALLGVTTGSEARPGPETEAEAEADGQPKAGASSEIGVGAETAASAAAGARAETGIGSETGIQSESEAVPADLAAAMRGYATLDRVARQLLSAHPLAVPSDEVAPDRRGLFEALQDVIQRAADDDADQDPERELAEHHPELAAHATLLRRCVAAVPEVLTGRKSGVEVLLPRGSADELAAVYQGNPGSDFHHRLLAERVAARARTIAAEQGRPARILEIGAGTGGGTGFVLRACAELEPLPAMDFTDVSAAFLTRAERELAGTYPKLAFRLLDIENDPVAQGLTAHDYDIVLAGNVLHATEDIAATLAQARALLRPGGLLLVNEVTRRSDFLTLTFGLTPGWWRFRDPDRRLPHAPLCSARQWREALSQAGLTVLEIGGIPGVPADRLQQVVAVAEEPAAAAAAPADPAVAEPSAAARVSAGAVRDYVKQVFAEVLKFDAADLDDTSQFDAFGIDSLVSLAIVDRFERDLGELPSTLLFEQQTIAVLADYLLQNRADQLAGVLAPSVPSVPSAPSALSEPSTHSAPPAPSESSAAVVSEPAPSAAVAAPAPPSRPENVSSDIAIIGVAGRYPGSPDLDAFWRNLASGADCVTEVPADRWDWREHFDARRGRPQHTYSKWGGFLDQVDQFDAGFFGVLPRDAAAMDPQERLFLETAWNLLQDAGHLGDGHARQATGVFVGTMYGSYGRMAAASGWPHGRFTDGHSSQWSIANRVSYTLDLRGPSFAVDSACSSSLTAVHLAAESLRRGECEVAIAGGVNLLLHPAHLVALSAMGMLSADGGCKVFDERANGFAPGEGVGAVLLKPLAAAVAEGDDVWAVIKGSHLNAGGRTAGYTVPNPNAQAELVVAAIRRSGIDPHGISYIEAHGTGTALGDPIEIAGLTRALHEAGTPQRCAVGSVKANIGHLEGAAGIAGLTKVLLQMRHGQIAPCANLERTNPKIDLADSPLWLPTEAVDWPAGEPRLAGVSSFGAGGANAHVVLESYEPVPDEGGQSFPTTADGEHVVLLSARSTEQLREMAADLATYVAERPELQLADVAFTSQVGRAEFAERLAVTAYDASTLIRRLQAFAAGEIGDGVVAGSSREPGDHAEYVEYDEYDGTRDVAELARQWVDGQHVRWRQMWPAGPRRRVALPEYPFQRRRFWLPEPAASVRTVALTGPEATEHRVGGRRWASGAALLEAVAADGVRLRDVRWPAPADLDVAGDKLRISVEDGKVSATAGDRTVVRALIEDEAAPPPPTADLPLLQATCRQQIDIADLYARLRAAGLDHGPGLRSVTGLWTGGGESLARLAAPASGRRWNAVLVDGALQALAALRDSAGTWVPAGVAVATSYQELPQRCWAHARERDAGSGRRRFDIEVLDDTGQVLLTLEGLEVAAVGADTPAGPEVHASVEVVAARSADHGFGAPSSAEPPSDAAAGDIATTMRYLRPTWTPAPAPASAPTAPAPATVLLLGGGPVAEAVAQLVESTGSRCVAGSGADRADFDLVLADLGGPVDAIVHIPEPESPFEPLLWGATALLAHPEHGPVRVVAAASPSVSGSAALAAALRTLALEHSAFAAATVECADDPDPQTVARHLLDELSRLEVSAPDTDRVREIRLARNGRWVRELAEFTPPADDDADGGGDSSGGLELKPGAVYLLTGGAGGLGRIVARHLSGRAPVTVVLAGRSALEESARAELAALAAPGSRIVYERADVSRADEVEQLLARVRRDHGEIRGVIHAAGVNRDARAVNKDPRQVAEVLGAKRDGARHLDAATAADPLDFVVFFSSVAAWTGNLGQVDYAYANACLDEFAAQRERRRAAGERSGHTVSIGWPLWAEGGMAVGDAARGWFARRWGSAPLATGDGLRALDRAVRAGESCVVVDNVLIDSAQPEPVADTRRAASAEEVHALLRRLAAGFLLVDERHVDLDADLMDAGFDSISLTELVGQVNEHYDVDVSPTVLFECVNLAGFARHLVEVEQVGEPQAAQTEVAVSEPVLSEPAVLEPAQPQSAQPEPTTPKPTSGPDPIAIVGMAAALPGAPDLAAFWQHLTAGDDLTGPVPADRTDLRADPRTRDIRGGFLDDVRTFDAAFFGVSPREAALMDPQQRLFLQTVWRAVEDAGYAPSSLAGTDTGLFAGVAASDYDDLLRAHSVEIEAHTASGVASCVLANRVSHLMDLHGPSEAMDTACSSALVAVHRAVRAIQSGECAAALAGGVNVLLSPGLFVAFEKSGMLAADGRCKTFDAAADGYARGEGVGVVYLKPLARALADGDHIHALIRGSAVNHGGRAPSLTAPNPAAQARVVAAAHRAAGADPADVGYIETHGTGTRLGDPIEIEGLKKAFAELGADRAGAREPWVALGSVKTNIGHLEAAAGIAGLLKTVLCLEHGQLPPTLNLTTPNPLLRLDETPFRLNDRLRPWPEGRRLAGVSSFGFGGTNAHVVVEAAPKPAAEPAADGPHTIILSAPSAWALTEYANRLAAFLTDRPDLDLARVAATLQYGREHLAHRVGFVASDVADAISLLRAAASEADEPRLRRAVVRATWRTAPAAPPDAADTAAPEPTSPEEAIATWAAGEPHPWSGRPPRGVRRLAGVPGFPFARTVHWFTSDRLETTVTPTSPISAAPVEPDRPKVRLAPAKRKSAPTAAPATAAPVATEPVAAEPATVARPAASLPDPDVAASVREHLAAVLGTTPEDVPADVAFADLGLDSILRMDVVRRLNDALGSELKAEDLYEHDTADALTAHLAAATDSTGRSTDTAHSQRPATTPDRPADRTVQLAAATPDRPADTAIERSDTTTDQPSDTKTDHRADQPSDHLADQLAERLSALSAAVTGRPLDASATFQDNAFTSFDMLRTIAALERGFGTLRKTLLFDQPTVAAVAAELLDRFGAQAVTRFLADDQALAIAAQPTPAPASAPAAPDPHQQSAAAPEPLVILKRSLSDPPDLAALVADLDSVHAKEGGLAGRDIAPYALIGTERLGYFNVSIRSDLLFAWSYVGTEEYFPILAAELFAYSRAHGLRPNFLSLLPLDSVAGEPITATPFGAVQRLENLADFSLRGGKMSRLRYMVGHFQKAGECRTVEYRSGQDPDIDRRIADMLDRWTENKDMVNPYVTVVRDEIEAGRLAQRHRMFLTYLDDTLANVIIVTRIPSEPGYLMDLEFYPKDGPLGGLEYAIVQIIEALRAEGHTVFSFGASFGVALGSTDNASPEAEQALAELREAGIFGEGNFQFKNKFRPVNVPIYLCQPVGADRTPVSEVILTIADPALTAPAAAPATAPAAAPANAPTTAPAPAADNSRRALLAAHDWNPLAVPHDRVELDLVTDSWAELDNETIRARIAGLATAAADQDPDARPDWLPQPYSLLTGSGRSAEALLCRTFPGRRAAVLHNGLFPTWYGSLIEAGFTPEAIARGGDADHDPAAPTEPASAPHSAPDSSPDSGPDLDQLTARLADTERPVSFICVELSCNAAGGFPVRLETLRAVRQAAEQAGVPLVLDAARIVENAAAEPGGQDLWHSVKDFLSLADAVTMSLSKDFAVPAGGLLALTDAAWASAATQHQLSAGRDLALAGRKQAAAALRDTETVEALVRERMAATAALWRQLSDAGLPVPQRPSGHCVLLDTSRLPALADHREPLMSALAWIFAETGVRGGPHLGDTPELKQMIRLAVPLGLGREPAADAGRRIASALGPGLSPASGASPASGSSSAPPDLVAAGDPASPAAMVYRPAADVPDDVADALRTGEVAADDNEAVLREACPTLERRLLPIAGGRVEVFTAGTGPALLLLAPFNIGAGLFARQFAALTDRFQLVAVHHPGVGATEGVADLSFDGLADLAREALAAVGADGPAHVAGASFGGLAALAFALRHPDHTATLTLIGSSYKVGNRVGEINRLGVVARDDFDAVEAACGPDRFAGRRAELERTLLRCESMDPRTGLRYLDVFATRPDLLGRLPQIAAPTLIIQGRHDTVVPVKAAHALYGAIPDARYVELADAGHFPCLTNAEEVNELLAERP